MMTLVEGAAALAALCMLLLVTLIVCGCIIIT